MERKPLLAILMVLVGCCSNVVFLELLVSQDPGIGNLVTFAQFLTIAIEGFIFTTKFGTVKPKVPFSAWVLLVIMYFLVSVSNNYALNFNIPMPLHMIFRAGSLMANMMLGVLLLGKQYTMSKYMSILMITVGIITCTYSSTSSKPVEEGEEVENEGEKEESWIMVGISLLTFALFMSARMGIYQVVQRLSSKKKCLYNTCLLSGGGLLKAWKTSEGSLVLHPCPPPAWIPSPGS